MNGGINGGDYIPTETRHKRDMDGIANGTAE